MRVGLIDVDGHNFPNLPLMKLSAYHKSIGDSVEWYNPLISGHLDKVYMSKVFSFTQDYPYNVDAEEVVKGGSGYCISLVDGKEVFDKSKDIELPYEIEHIYPDYSIYYDTIPEVKNTAYGFLSRGCPRGCEFCHVKDKEGRRAYKVADLSEFWNGQRNIVLLDPNITACMEWRDLFQQLIDSKATVDFSQGLDIRLMTEEKAEMLKHIKVNNIHFAWDRYEDKDLILPKLKMFKEISKLDHRKLTVYTLTNFDTTIEQDLERIYTLRELGFNPYVMIYNKENTTSKDTIRQIQRWVNNRFIWEKTPRFEDYKKIDVKKDIDGQMSLELETR